MARGRARSAGWFVACAPRWGAPVPGVSVARAGRVVTGQASGTPERDGRSMLESWVMADLLGSGRGPDPRRVRHGCRRSLRAGLFTDPKQRPHPVATVEVYGHSRGRRPWLVLPQWHSAELHRRPRRIPCREGCVRPHGCRPSMAPTDTRGGSHVRSELRPPTPGLSVPVGRLEPWRTLDTTMPTTIITITTITVVTGSIITAMSRVVRPGPRSSACPTGWSPTSR